MNYGREFVDTYNTKLLSICEEFTHDIEHSFKTNYKYNKVKQVFTEKLVLEIKILRENENGSDLFQESESLFEFYKDYYESEISISIINDETFKNFSEQKDKTKFRNYEEFIKSFALRKAIGDFFKFESESKKELIKLFKKKDVQNAFNFEKKEKEIFKFKSIKKSNITVVLTRVTDLTQNEKMIILHVLIHHYIDNTKRIPSTIYFRILSLCCSGLEDLDFYAANTNKTKYNYFNLGVHASEKRFKGDKKKMIDEIVSKIHKLENIGKFIDALNRYKNTKI